MKEKVPETNGSEFKDLCDAMENASFREGYGNRYFDHDSRVNDVFFWKSSDANYKLQSLWKIINQQNNI